MRKAYVVLFAVLICSYSYSGEITVEIVVPDRESLREAVYAGFMVDDYNNQTGIARGVVGEEDLVALENLGYPVEILPDTDARRIAAANMEPSGYPLHSEYVTFMQNVAIDHPIIANLDTFGWSVNGRPLLMMKISTRVTWDETEPEFCYISTMHGDEPPGMIFLMWFIDSLTDNYGIDPRITRLVDSCEIFINPLLNPDGYVAMTRRNAHNIDLNRNYPVPDGTIGEDNLFSVEPETDAILNWFPQHNISYTINFHTGALVANYPWDYKEPRTTDDSLYKFIAVNYSIRNPPMYSGSFPYGIINGYDWYEVDGSIQDWTYWTNGDLHLTVELNNIKTPSFSTLDDLWEDNYDAYLAAVEVMLNHGVHGVVTDSVTGESLGVNVKIDEVDKEVFSDPDNGYYHRILLAGTYHLTFSKPGYSEKSVTVVVPDSGLTRLDVLLTPRDLEYVFETDFEADNGGFLTRSFAYYEDWEWGIPSQGIIAAHSGDKVWATELTGEYHDSSQSRLVLEDIVLPDVDSLTLSFWQWYSFQPPTGTPFAWHDGGNIKVWTSPTDSVILTPEPGYIATMSEWNNLIPYQEAFADLSGAKWWHKVTADLSLWRGENVDISWDFGSSSVNTQVGWYIDDVSIFYPDTTAVIASENRLNPDIFRISVHPNPFNSSCRIFIENGYSQFRYIEIYDICGCQVAKLPVETIRSVETGGPGTGPSEAIWRPEENLSSGIYLVRAGKSQTARIVLLK